MSSSKFHFFSSIPIYALMAFSPLQAFTFSFTFPHFFFIPHFTTSFLLFSIFICFLQPYSSVPIHFPTTGPLWGIFYALNFSIAFYPPDTNFFCWPYKSFCHLFSWYLLIPCKQHVPIPWFRATASYYFPHEVQFYHAFYMSCTNFSTKLIILSWQWKQQGRRFL